MPKRPAGASIRSHNHRLLLEPLEPRLVLDGGPLISEFMAVNESALVDGDGNFEDWIEIYNPTAAAIDLDGWFLTDDPSDRTQWSLPAVTIDSGEYYVVFASNKPIDDYIDGQGNLHTNFALAREGESVAIVEPDGVTIAHAYEDYPEQLPDVSYGITGATTHQQTLVSSGDNITYHVPTPGEDPLAWTASAYNDDAWEDTVSVDAAGVLITEIGTGSTKLVEVQNVSDQAVDTTDWSVLVNDASAGINAPNSEAWSLPGSIAANEVLFKTDDVGEDYWGAPIDWDAEGPGWAMIVDDAGHVMDFVAWGYTGAEIAALNLGYGSFPSITVASQWSGGGAAEGTTGGGPPTEDWTAFNDHVPDYAGGTHANTTAYSANATTSGWLKNIDTGANTDVTLTVTASGVRYANLQGNPASGTDAHDVFDGYVDLSSNGGGGTSIEINNNDHYTYTFSGLDTGDAVTYDFAGTAVRGRTGYTNRWTLVTLQGTDAFSLAHSSGDGVVTSVFNPSINPNQVAIWTGENHQGDQGFVAGWTDVDPGSDGSFAVRTEQYTGSVPTSADPDGMADGSKGYGVTGIRLREVAPSGPEAWLKRVGNTDRDTAADFVRTTSESKGTQNPNVTVPFGTVIPATLGVGFSADQAPFDSLIQTDLGDAMEGVNASLWTRVEFDGDDMAARDNLTLRMKYDDGFIAYLNGAEVTRRNADDPLAWNTAASAEHDNAEAVVFEDIDVSSYLGQLTGGTNLLAIHGQNVSTGDADLLIVPELVVSGTSFDSQPKWFTSPTPRSSNGTGGGFPGIVINEIHYDPDVRTERVEFIELYNGGPDPVDLSDWYFDDGVDYVFPGGTTITDGGYVVVTQDVADFHAKFGFTPLGPWTGRLDGEGERIQLRNALGERVDEVDYRRGFPWPTVGDAPGNSIELVSPSLDNNLGGSWRPSVSGPTPGAPNSTYTADANVAPHIRQVNHSPKQPASGEEVTVTIKVTDPNGVQNVTLHYQLVDPGSYIQYDDPAYQANWTDLPMVDDGTAGDETAGDSIYTVVIPGTFQTHRRLVRYRITATDDSADHLSRTGPYEDDPAGNFAYFVYYGVPGWSGAIDPDSGDAQLNQVVHYSSEVLTQVPVYHLITTRQEHLDAMHVPYRWGQADQQTPSGGSYGGSEYRWNGTLVYDGEVYDHIRYRARGGVWRYAMGKNMWKFDFNRGHGFQAKDDFGDPYDTTWDKLNFSACIQQGNYQHRGEQGTFEAAGFKMFNLVGVEAPKTNWAHFRIIESADEFGPDQYSGDFRGLYMTIEQMDGRFLDEHDLADGNLYKIEGHNAQMPPNNQGPTAVDDRSDFNAFKNGYYYDPNPTEQWWRDNVELQKYYSYRAIVEGIHHGDIAYGKNWFFYLDPETDLWSMLPWDLDLTWANNMYGNGNDCFRSQGAILSNPALDLELKNRLREIDDLLYNAEQMNLLLDELAGVIDDPDPGQLSIVDADRAMWDYNPILVSPYVNSSKAGHGRFYQQAATKDFPGMVQIMKDYVVSPNRTFATDTTDPDLPDTPTISYVGPAGYPVNRATFQSSAFSDATGAFAAMEWRVGEVTDPNAPAYDPADPLNFEITAVWESGEITTFDNQITVAPDALEVGHAYRARVRMKDSTGRWSHWSQPVHFFARESNETVLTRSLRVTEIMYNPADPPPGGSYDHDEFEFIELRNVGQQTLDISGVSFTDGITFSFATSGVTSLDPGEFVVVAKNLTALESRYDTTGMNLVGGYTGILSNGGERIVLSDFTDGVIQDFSYKDGWYGVTDRGGFSLTIVDELADRDEWNNKGNWGASGPVGGSPGTVNGGTAPGSIIINEVLAHTDGYPNDVIELHNTTDEAIDIGGWFLSDSNDSTDDLMKYRIAPDTTIPAGQYLLFTQDDHFGPGSGDPGSAVAFALSEFGDDVYLSSYANVQLDGPAVVPGGYREHVDFGASPNGLSIGLHTKSTGGTDFTLLSSPTLDGLNDPPLMDDLVINEVMYHPADPTPDEFAAGFASDEDFEFIELTNRSGMAVDLTEFRVGEGVGFTFGWYDADAWGNEIWTLQAGATATWQAVLGAGHYQVYARWDVTDGQSNTRQLDSSAQYEITYDGGSDLVTIDQNLNTDPDAWVLLGTYDFDGAARVELSRGTEAPDQWTIADQVKFFKTGTEVMVDNASGDFTASACDETTLAAGQYVLLVSNRSAFDYRYGTSGMAIAGQYTGNLSNNGEKVKVLKADTPETVSGYVPYYRVDYINYGDDFPWPTEPDGQGASLSRIETDLYGNDPGNWGTGTSNGTPGAANVYLDTTPPSVPTGLTASNFDGIRIDLDWVGSQDPQSDVDHYVIYRNGAQIDTTPTDDYSDVSVVPATPYSYQVSAVNRDGYESNWSDPAAVTVPGITALTAIDGTTLKVVFSETLARATAEDEDNYVLSDASVVLAVLEADNLAVTLTTSQFENNRTYTLTVNDVQTVSGSLMPVDLQESFIFRPEGSGTILREYWTGIGGSSVWDLTNNPNYPDHPTGDGEVTSFEGPTNWNDSYGTRVRGYVHPPITGSYVFWIASDDASQLWLSTDDDPANRQLIASVSGWTSPRQWNKFSSQESTELYLEAGPRYYIEALQKEGSGGDHLAVRWALPGGTWEDSGNEDLPIPGVRLSPWVPEEPAQVVGRHIFYNNSYFDGFNAAPGVTDDNAIAPDPGTASDAVFGKRALLPGQTATRINYTSYSRGINGIMVDIEDLADVGGLSAADLDFHVGNTHDPSTWGTGPGPTSVTVRPGAGINGSDRVTLVWNDDNIQNQWLQVTVKANATTGLDVEDVFYFGNAVGESLDSPSFTFVDGTDFAGARDNTHNTVNRASRDDPYDYNRDSLVDAADLAIARDSNTNFLTALKLITAPSSGGSSSSASSGLSSYSPSAVTFQPGEVSSALDCSVNPDCNVFFASFRVASASGQWRVEEDEASSPNGPRRKDCHRMILSPDSEAVSTAFENVETLDTRRSLEIPTETCDNQWVLAVESYFLSEFGQAQMMPGPV